MPRSIGERLARARRDALVGRDAEVAALADFVADPARVLVCLHGPGGVGKTVLLDALAANAVSLGREVVALDCADFPATIAGLLAALTRAAGVDTVADVAPDTFIALDHVELLGDSALWLWPSFVGALPEGVKVGLAGRLAPPPQWTDDPAFAKYAAVVPVRNLAPADAAELARSRGMTGDEAVAALVRVSRGHPLAIVIGTDSDRVEGDDASRPRPLRDHPDAVSRLLGRFLHEAVDDDQRAALHVCGQARRVDRAMLQRALAVDERRADELLAWLRSLPYAESHVDGLTLHDLVRDALDWDLRWRDTAAFTALHSRVREIVLERMATASGAGFDQHARDLLHLHRGNPEAQQLLGLGSAAIVARPVSVGDRDEAAWLRALFATHGQSEAVDYWLRTQPAGVTVFEDSAGTKFGAALMVRLDTAPADVGASDTVAGWALRELARIRPVEPGEVVIRNTVVDNGDPSRAGALATEMAAMSLREWRMRGLGWTILSTAEEQRWAPVWSYIGFERLGSCAVAGIEIAVWARDFARSPFADWLARLEASEIDETGTAPPPIAAQVALSRDDFADAVRRVLKDLHHRERVRRNPLIDSRLAGAESASGLDVDPADTLTTRVRAAVDELDGDPKQRLAARALDRTFLRPSGSQERAAEVLGVPFSTYRRHLAAGIEQLTSVLWDWELHGVPAVARAATAAAAGDEADTPADEQEVGRNRTGE